VQINMAKSAEELREQLRNLKAENNLSGPKGEGFECSVSAPKNSPPKDNFPATVESGAGPRGAQRWSGEKPTAERRTPAAVKNGHRHPPHSVEAEQGVIGSMLLSPRDTIAECVEKITDEYFYVPAHRLIYARLAALWDKGETIDLITFTQHLRDVGQLDVVGGPAFVTELFTFVPTSANVGYYLDILRDKYLLREVIAASTESIRRAYEEQDEVNALIDELEQRIFTLGDDRFKGELRSMKDNVMRAVELMDEAYTRKGGITGVATGFQEFDAMTGGLQPSEMIVIAARPSMGKTALVMNIAEYASVNSKLPVGIFSLEMSVEQLTQRLLCSRAKVNLQKVRHGFLNERDFPSLTSAASVLAEAKMIIDDASSITILELRARARRLKAQHDIQLLIVDYLQLLRSNSKKSQDNRQIEISEISAGLKGLAKELKIPVLVAAQLNRQPEARHGGKPRLSDLRESGSIEQDSDTVGLLVRPEIYEDDEEARAELAGEAELIIAKQRNGPVGEIPLTFLKEFTRFETRDRNYEPAED
jgi:replicative DNA helicase